MASGGEEGTSAAAAGGKGLEDVRELARALPELYRREPTEADFERYKAYEGQRWTGVCKWYNVAKGFGFIVPDVEEATLGFVVPDAEEANQHGDDVIVHQSKLQMAGFRSLDEGAQVEFSLRVSRHGLEARNVCVLEGGQPMLGHRIHHPSMGKRKGMTTKGIIRCYNCGQFGHHKAAKCMRMPCQQDRDVKLCYVCQSAEHLVADCPHR